MTEGKRKAFEGEIRHGEDKKACPVLLAAHLSNGGHPMTSGRTDCLGAGCQWFVESPVVSGCIAEVLVLALLNFSGRAG